MTDYTIANEFTLPSLGKVYKREINPHVKLRSMTTAEEMKRLNHSDKAYKQLAEIIDDCTLNDIGISSYDMCVADYQFLMHRLRLVTYGPEYRMVAKCPFCYMENEYVIDLENDLNLKEFDQEIFDSCSEFILPASKHKIKLHMQSPRDIDDVAAMAKDRKKKAAKNSGDPAFLLTLSNLIEKIDDKNYEEFEKEPFLQKLPMRDTNYILKAAQKLNSAFGLESDVTHTCTLCNSDYISTFRITSEFFGPSIDF